MDKKYQGKKNSLLELYRFLFALWVVIYHGFFLVDVNGFSQGHIAVEFFFILSGFYLLKSMDRQSALPLWLGAPKLCWKRIKSLGVTYLISVLFVFWYMGINFVPYATFWDWLFYFPQDILGYMWYIPHMLLAIIFVYILRKCIKTKWIFVATMLATAMLGHALYWTLDMGMLRCFAGVSLGVAVSFIKKIELKAWKFDFTIFIVAIVFIATVALAYLPKPTDWNAGILVFILFPALIYFSANITFHNRFLDFLGAMSFGLYAYQCILRVIEHYSAPNLEQHWYFLILLGFVLLDRAIAAIYRKYKEGEMQFLQSNG